MAMVFLTDLEKEREKQKMQLHKLIDPRSAARTPAANRMPHYKLRYTLKYLFKLQYKFFEFIKKIIQKEMLTFL